MTISEIFKPLPVRRKELERNAKREFGKALNLLNAYALVPCAQENGGVRLTCTHQPKGGYVYFPHQVINAESEFTTERNQYNYAQTAHLPYARQSLHSGVPRRSKT